LRRMRGRFDSIYSHGFIRAAVCVPSVRVADPAYNTARTIEMARQASEAHAALVLFPELGISAYSNEDLFHQDALLDACITGLDRLVRESVGLGPLILVGVPLRVESRLYNCAVLISRGRILGVVPKTHLPNYREFYEKRQFTSGRERAVKEFDLLGRRVPFGNDLVFAASSKESFRLHVEICEDVWTPLPPSSVAALGGATVLCNLSASNITIGKSDYRHILCASQSGRCIAAYLYSAAGFGESTTDLAWDGQALIYENGELLAESERFASSEQMILGDIDLDRLVQDRMRNTCFNEGISDYRDLVGNLRRVPFEFTAPETAVPLHRTVQRFPYVPADVGQRDQRCYEAYNIQVHGLLKRLVSTGINKVVIGISGGLDSTHALLVAARTMDRMGLPRANVLAYTMPGFATSGHTLANAHKLMRALKVSGHELDIRPSCMQMLRDLSHPFSQGDPVYDITFENVQAGERTSHLFRLANQHQALVVGTGDLSEAALGWMTYGVGDQMSHYNVNVSVPKTLIQFLIRWVIGSGEFDPEANAVFHAVLETEISPELVPNTGGDSSRPAQKTSETLGPYELQDFNLYYISRYGFRPSKVAYLALNAWRDAERGHWPDLIPTSRRTAYDLPTIRKWLRVFLHRFFKTSQFKRSAMPNGPKVGSGGSLSPRGDWRAPSDSEAEAWMAELDDNVPLEEVG
jgi:NAD+ synthase (glutamine-hydrolysing)